MKQGGEWGRGEGKKKREGKLNKKGRVDREGKKYGGKGKNVKVDKIKAKQQYHEQIMEEN